MRVIFFCMLVLVPSVVFAEQAEDPTARRHAQVPLSVRAVNEAAAYALGAIKLAEEKHQFVDTSRQLVAEMDFFCMVAFTQKDKSKNTLRITDHWCYKQNGSYDLRKKGLPRSYFTGLTRKLRELENHPKSWQRFMDEVLGNPHYYAALQQLFVQRTRANLRERQLVLKIALRRDAVFVNQYHPAGNILTGS